MGTFQFSQLLSRWLQEIKSPKFDWDPGNKSKIAKKHGVSRREIEDVFNLGGAKAVGMQIDSHAGEPRAGVVGPTREGRLIFVLFTLRNGNIRPISARDADNWEKEIYEEI